MYKTIKFDIANGIATLSLNRPDRYNAFNEEMSMEMIAALKEVKKNADVRVLVISGEGKAFCSGQDLKDISGKEGRSLGESVKKRYNPMIKAIRELPKPVLCQLNGVAAGAGCSLALACDMIIASEKASLIEVFINVGLVLDSGSSYFLPRYVGSAKAFELATLAPKISAQEALNWGMVNQVVAADELADAVGNLAERFAKAPTKAIGYIKKMLNQSLFTDLDGMLEQEAFYQELAGRSEDYKEGVQAFVEKREPKFSGN